MRVPVAEALPSVAEALPPGCGGFARFLQKHSQLLVLGLEFDNIAWSEHGTAQPKIVPMISPSLINYISSPRILC